jgi:2-isopropylmalate synthase
MSAIALYDCTLRDGTQGEEITFSVDDKLRISEKLDDLGVHYIEGGWPGSNPKDIDFFQEVHSLKLRKARIVAFGSTRRASLSAQRDPNLRALLEAKTPVVTIFGKSWDLHVRRALRTTLARNLELIEDSVAYLKRRVDEVIYDAEHFFDGYKANPRHATKTLQAAVAGGADCIVLCDTNGGSLPSEISTIFGAVRGLVSTPLGIHTHNDGELAVANTLAAVQQGAVHVQGCVNGYGERCGNANLISIIPNLKLKLGLNCVSNPELRRLREVSRFVDELANRNPWIHQPFVGNSAFAHKGGIHVQAIMRDARTYEHIRPELLGNRQRVLISDLSGKSNVLYKAKEYGLRLDPKDTSVQSILKELKRLEHEGYQFDGAEGSFELLMQKAKGSRQEFFKLVGFRVTVEKHRDEPPCSEATIRLSVNGELEHAVAEGNGPVNALDNALRKALEKFYPEIREMELVDYKVRILNERAATQATTRVLIESTDHKSRWGTVGVSPNIIEASWQALEDSLEYKLTKARQPKKPRRRGRARHKA